MQKYFLVMAKDDRLLDEVDSLKRAYYLAWSYSNSWDEPVAIVVGYGEHMEDFDIVEPDGLY